MKFLIVVDMQNDFITGSLGAKEAEAIVPNVVKKMKDFDIMNGEIICTQDTHFDDYLETNEGKSLPVIHCRYGTNGWCFPQEIEAITLDQEVFKLKKFSFGSMRLPKLINTILKELDETIESIEIVGLCTDICVISNALILKAAFPEIEIIVDPSCCAGTNFENHEAALEVMRSCQIKVKIV